MMDKHEFQCKTTVTRRDRGRYKRIHYNLQRLIIIITFNIIIILVFRNRLDVVGSRMRIDSVGVPRTHDINLKSKRSNMYASAVYYSERVLPLHSSFPCNPPSPLSFFPQINLYNLRKLRISTAKGLKTSEKKLHCHLVLYYALSI